MSKIVVATQTTTFFIGAQRVHVNEGAAWAADSIAVQQHPDLFTDDPTRALGLDLVPEPSSAGPVEQKTAAPGEKSNARRIFGRQSKK